MSAGLSTTLLAIRILHFWATAVLVGGGALAWRLRPEQPRAGVRLLRGAALVAGLTGLAWFAATLAGVTGANDAILDGQAWRDFLTAPFGPPWAVLLGLSLAACLFAAVTGPRIAALLGAAMAIDQPWLGHAAAGAGSFGTMMIVDDAIHIVAGYAWVGALAMLVAQLRAPATLHRGLAVVSGLGPLAVAALLASGALNAAAHLGAGSDLVTTTYGRILLGKVGVVSAMLGLALLNRRDTRRDPGLRRLSLAVGLETVLGFVVLGLAAWLGISEPPS